MAAETSDLYNPPEPISGTNLVELHGFLPPEVRRNEDGTIHIIHTSQKSSIARLYGEGEGCDF